MKRLRFVRNNATNRPHEQADSEEEGIYLWDSMDSFTDI